MYFKVQGETSLLLLFNACHFSSLGRRCNRRHLPPRECRRCTSTLANNVPSRPTKVSKAQSHSIVASLHCPGHYVIAVIISAPVRPCSALPPPPPPPSVLVEESLSLTASKTLLYFMTFLLIVRTVLAVYLSCYLQLLHLCTSRQVKLFLFGFFFS